MLKNYLDILLLKVKRAVRFILLSYPIPLLLTTLACSACKEAEPMLVFRKLLVEYAENPVNIDIPHPRFSWIAESGERGAGQSSFRILVASTEEQADTAKADIWDSGEQKSGQTIQHPFVPDKLRSFTTYYWKVLVRDNKGNLHSSKVSKFETSFLPGTAWTGKWIGSKTGGGAPPENGFYKSVDEQYKTADTVEHDGRSLLLRHEVVLTRKIRKASAYITGMGLYEFSVNGVKVGTNELAPAKTPYHKYILYDTWDITGLLEEGRNAFGIHLGNGWYNPYKKWWNEYRMQWFGHKKAIAEIHVTYFDGTEDIISTGPGWFTAPGPVLFGCIYDGELRDAHCSQEGWDRPGFDQAGWEKAIIYNEYLPVLISHRMPPVKVNQVFVPREVKSHVAGTRIFDMGQNFTGRASVTVQGKAGTRITLGFAEDLASDSTLDKASNENALASAVYILRGGGKETYTPLFSYFGFRYVSVTSDNQLFDLLDIKGEALWSSNEETGSFSCGSELVNRMHHATVWSQKSNMLGYPMDCPQRDERLGWMGDAQVTCEEALFNFDMALFYDNWLTGIAANQDRSGDIPVISPRPYIRDTGVEWSSTYLYLLWQYFTFYGDTAILDRHYEQAKKYLAFLDSAAQGKIIAPGWIGDWGSMTPGWKEGDPASVPTGYYYLDASLLSSMAAVLGKKSDQACFAKKAEEIAGAYNRAFFDTVSGNYNDGSQMANAFPGYLGIVPVKYREKVMENIVNDILVKHDCHLTTGVLGTKFMPEDLASMGRHDIVWRLITQRTPPSWYDMMKRYNTMCEFWTLKQSKNHVMMGSIDAWFYRYLAGIRPDPMHPGFSEFIIQPWLPADLDRAEASTGTIRGKIYSGWEKLPGGTSFTFIVPFGTRAKVYIPGKEGDIITESGKPAASSEGVRALGYDGNSHVYILESGSYNFFNRK